jgi:hypothetical protein
MNPVAVAAISAKRKQVLALRRVPYMREVQGASFVTTGFRSMRFRCFRQVVVALRPCREGLMAHRADPAMGDPRKGRVQSGAIAELNDQRRIELPLPLPPVKWRVANPSKANEGDNSKR